MIKILLVLDLIFGSIAFSQWSRDPGSNNNVNSGQIVTMCANKFGELYVLWNDGLLPRLQLIDSSGVPLWGAGYLVTKDSAQVFGPRSFKSKIMVSESGKCYVVWHDSRKYPSPLNRTMSDVMIQAFDRLGNRLMNDNGVCLTDLQSSSSGMPIGFVNDTTIRVVLSLNEDSSIFQMNFQDISQSGLIRFPIGGKELLTNQSVSQALIIDNNDFILLTETGKLFRFENNGHIIWEKNTGYDPHKKMKLCGTSIYLVSISIMSEDSSGYKLVYSNLDLLGNYLLNDSIKVFATDALSNAKPQIVSGYFNDAFVSYLTFQRQTKIIHLKAEEIDEISGMPFLGDSYFYQYQSSVTTNGNGGIIVVASDSPIAGQGSGLYTVNINSNNASVWGNKSAIVTSRIEPTKYEPYMVVSDSMGGFFCGWTERGDGGGFGTFIQKINRYGVLGNILHVQQSKTQTQINKIEIFPNPTNGNVRFLIKKENGDYQPVVMMYDILGRLVKNIGFESSIERDDKIIVLDLTQNDFTELPSGQYFIKVKMNNSYTVSKFIYIK